MKYLWKPEPYFTKSRSFKQSMGIDKLLLGEWGPNRSYIGIIMFWIGSLTNSYAVNVSHHFSIIIFIILFRPIPVIKVGCFYGI